MSAQKFISAILQIDRMIRMHRPLDPAALAGTLNISLRCLYKYLRVMKDLDVPLRYSRSIGRYYYEKEGKFFIGFLKDE
jgi:hypothetical protein